MDTSVKPGDDFYRYVNGTWVSTFEMPPDKARYGVFDALRDKSEVDVRTLLDELAATPRAAGSVQQKVADLYGSWMDEAAIEARGIEPLEADLDAISAARTKTDVVALMGNIDYAGPIGVYISPDPADPTRYVVNITQAGLGMPVRDYYLNEGDTFDAYRAAYKAYVTKIFELIGDASPGRERRRRRRPRDGAGHRALVAGAPARRAGDEQSRRSCRPRGDDPGHRLGHLPARRRLGQRAEFRRQRDHGAARRRRAARHAARRHVEEVSRVPSCERLREQPAQSVRRRELRLLSPDARRRRSAARSLEARRAASRRPHRRGRRRGLRREVFPAGLQSQDGRARRQPRRGDEPAHEDAPWMDDATRAEAAEEARHLRSPRRLSGEMARLLGLYRRTGQALRERAQWPQVRLEPPSHTAQRARRPRRVGHEPADGQRVLQPARRTRSRSRPRSSSRRSSIRTPTRP